MVPPASRPAPRTGRYSGTPLRAVPRRRLRGSHPLRRPIPGDFGWLLGLASVGPTTPRPQGPRFGLGRVRSPLLAPSRLISLPPGTEMFQFPGFASVRRRMTELTLRRVAPFGHLGLIACVRLPRAVRSLPRPSSPPCAQASPTCPRSLDYKLRQAEHARSTSAAFGSNTALQRVNGFDRSHMPLGSASIAKLCHVC